MGCVKPREWYEETYRRQQGQRDCLPTFKPPWPHYSNWHLRLPRMADWVEPRETVLDVGCGPGIFAAVLWHQGHRARYYGIDFSEVQLERAIEGNRREGHQNARFLKSDILEHDPFGHWASDVVVLAEILEHLEDDLGLLRKIESGTKVLITVPTRDDPSHVRVFSQEGDDLVDRYGGIIEFHEHIPIRDRHQVLYHIAEGSRR